MFEIASLFVTLVLGVSVGFVATYLSGHNLPEIFVIGSLIGVLFALFSKAYFVHLISRRW